MPRLISLVSNTSRIALTRSSLFASIRIDSSDHLMTAPTFLKSNRVEISLPVWFSALSTSWWSTLLTMSKEESAMPARYPTVVAGPPRPDRVPGSAPHGGDHDDRARPAPPGADRRARRRTARDRAVHRGGRGAGG